MRPRDSVRKIGYLTPDAIPDARQCRAFSIPNDTDWLGLFMGVLEVGLQESAWIEYGALTPEECAAQWLQIFFSFETECGQAIETPFWDNATDVDDSATTLDQTWYGRMG